MTPIGSTSSNIRRAIEFIVCSSCCMPGAPCGHSRSPGRLRAAKLIARGRPAVHGAGGSGPRRKLVILPPPELGLGLAGQVGSGLLVASAQRPGDPLPREELAGQLVAAVGDLG